MIMQVNPNIEHIDNEEVREICYKYKTKISQMKDDLLRMGESEEISRIEDMVKRVEIDTEEGTQKL